MHTQGSRERLNVCPPPTVMSNSVCTDTEYTTGATNKFQASGAVNGDDIA